MSGHSYPSPISSTSSPNLNNLGPLDGPPTIERRQQERYRNTSQRSLQSAAASLEAAFARLEQVRASLVQLSDRLADSNSQQTSHEHPQVGPGHEAIILTGDLGEESSDLLRREMQSSEEAHVVSEFQDSLRRAVQAQSSLSQLVEQVAANRASPATLPSARVPHRPLPPNAQAPRYLDLALGDDRYTALGRHVAAREAAASQNSAQLSEDRSTSNPSGDSSAPPRPRRPEHGRLEPLVEEALSAARRASQTGDLNELRRLSQIHNQLSSPATPPHVWRQGDRRRRNLRPDTRQSSARPSGSDYLPRLSMLSSISGLQNFSTPSSTLSRPLLFDEPETFTQSPIQEIQEADMLVDDVPFGRNYIIRRRMNAEGVERVQNINLEWNEGDQNHLAWLRPREEAERDPVDPSTRRRMLSNFQERTQRSLPPVPSQAPTASATLSSRRRGWARLDPDGNEIPSDEEEELERIRMEYRIRASGQSRPPSLHSGALAGSSDVLPHMLHGSVMDSVANIGDSYRQQRIRRFVPSEDGGDHRSLEIDPLPVPLGEMVSHRSEPYDQLGFVVIVPKHASFAGR